MFPVILGFIAGYFLIGPSQHWNSSIWFVVVLNSLTRNPLGLLLHVFIMLHVSPLNSKPSHAELQLP